LRPVGERQDRKRISQGIRGRGSDRSSDAVVREGGLERTLVRLEKVGFQIDGRWVLKEISFSIRPGEHTWVYGETGSGKTILAAVLAGEIVPSCGEVEYGEDSSGRPICEHDVLYVSFEEQRLFHQESDGYYQARWEQQTLWEAVSVRRWLEPDLVWDWNPFEVREQEFDFDRYSRRLVQAKRIFGLSRIWDRPLSQLSTGELRRAQLARAWLREPALWVLDDPAAGLDPEGRAEILEALFRIEPGRSTLLLFSPDSEPIPRWVQQRFRLQGGRLIRETDAGRDSNRNAEREEETESLDVSKKSGRGRLSPALSSGPCERTDCSKPFPGAVPSWLHTSSVQTPSSQTDGVLLLSLRHGEVRYGDDVVVLKEIDWKILLGQQWVLMGPNGSGKTTLLQLIAGDHPQAYATELRLLGRRFSSEASRTWWKRRVALYSTETVLHAPQDLPVLSILAGGMQGEWRIRSVSRTQRRRAIDLLKWLGLEVPLDAPFQALASGEQRLVLFARALMRRPMLLLLDEPCSGLDRTWRKRILAVLDQLAKGRICQWIYVTHRPEEFPESATHLLRLNRGQIVEQRPLRSTPIRSKEEGLCKHA